MEQTTVQLPTKTSTEVMQIHPNVSFQWLHNGKAFAITLTDSSRSAIDSYVEANIAALRLWEPSARFYSLQDLSHPNVTITPYFRSRLDDVLTEIKAVGLTGQSVIVLANTIVGNLVRLYGRFFAGKAEPIQQTWVNGLTQGQRTLEQLLQKHA